MHDTFGMDVVDDSNCTEIAGVAVAWNEHSCFYLPATAGINPSTPLGCSELF